MIVSALIPVMVGPTIVSATEMANVIQQSLNSAGHYRLGPPIRLKGFSTVGIVDNQKWSGPNSGGVPLAIIGTCNVAQARGRTRTIFLAVPDDHVGRGLSKEQFRQLLAQGIDLGPDRQAELEAEKAKREAEQQQLQLKKEKVERELREEAERRRQEKIARVPQIAASKLKLGKSLQRDGKIETAKRWYREVITEYPGTPAAKEARSLLRELGN